MRDERVAIARKNVIVSLVGSGIVLLALFLTRTALVAGVDETYLGIHAVLTNFNALFAIVELGVTVGMVHRYAQAIASDDTETLAAARQAAAKFYRIAAFAFIAMAVVLFPVAQWVIRDTDLSVFEFGVVYGVFALSAWALVQLGQNRILLSTHGMAYRVTQVEIAASLLFTVVQCWSLLHLGSYVAYVTLVSAQSIVVLVIVRVIARRRLPKAFRTQLAPGLLVRQWVELVRDLKSLAAFRVGAAALNATDGIIIAVVVSTAAAGLWSNYGLLVAAATTISMRMVDSLMGPISNHVSQASPEARTRVFHELNSLTLILFSAAAIAIGTVLTPFVSLWLGDEYVLEYAVTLVMALVFFAIGSNQTTSQYRWSLGIFKPARFIPILATVINLAFSFILGYQWGILGVLLGSLVARVATFSVIDPILVLRNGLGSGVGVYFMRVGFFAVGVLMVILATHAVLVASTGETGFKALVVAVLCASAGACALTAGGAVAFPSVRGALRRLKRH